MKKYISLLIAAFFFLACNNTSEKEVTTGISPADSLLNKVEIVTGFSAITDSSKLMVVKRNTERILYPAYKNSFEVEREYMQPAFTPKDIDGDGNKEIVTTYYTGGAHCCDVTTILSRTGENEMTEVLDFTGGTYISKDTVTLSFFEALGYFHTCYACGVDYPGNIDPYARFSFSKGKLTFMATSSAGNEAIEKNLQFLQAKGVPDKDSDGADGFDDGTRKAFAFNLVAYYYNNGRNMSLTKKMFDQYYLHKDKETIWRDISKYITGFDKDIEKGVAL